MGGPGLAMAPRWDGAHDGAASPGKGPGPLPAAWPAAAAAAFVGGLLRWQCGRGPRQSPHRSLRGRDRALRGPRSSFPATAAAAARAAPRRRCRGADRGVEFAWVGSREVGWPRHPGTGLGSRVPLGRVRMGRPEGRFASGYPKGGLARAPWDRAGLQGTLRAGSDGAP